MKNNPRISVIVICWNNKGFLEECFTSLLKQTYPNLELILSDNGSWDGSVTLVKTKFPTVRIIENKTNLGFAEGNNVAMRLILKENLSDFIFILNPDTVIEPKCVEYLVNGVIKNPTIGCFVPKMRVLNKPNKISAAGGDCPLKCGDNLSRAFYFNDEGQFDQEEYVFGPSGAAALYKCDMLKEIGLYDKHLFTYYEDVDLNFRIQLSGWKALYIPKAVVYHYHSGTLDDFNPHKTYLLNRNKYYTILKNYPLKLLLRFNNDLIRSFLAFAKYCFENKLFKTWLKIILFEVISLPIIIINRIKIWQLVKKGSIERIARFIEEHEILMNSEKRNQCVNEYLEDLKSRSL